MSASLNLFANTREVQKNKAIYGAAQSFLPYLLRGKNLDRTFVRQAMTMAFMGSDADGVWNWKDSYDATEVAMVCASRRNHPQLCRLEDAPSEIISVLSDLSALGMTHTRRSEEQVDMDQFSTPLEIGALAALAAQIRQGDLVLEPSAGNGLLAIIAEVLGAKLHLNELAETRHDTLALTFKGVPLTRHNALQLKNLLPTAGSFDVVLSNPPFTNINQHLMSSMACLADNGRMSAIVPTFYFDSKDFASLSADYAVRARIEFPKNAFAKHGTSVDTALLVVDRAPAGVVPALIRTADHSEVIEAIASIPARLNAKPRQFRSTVTVFRPAAVQRAIAASQRLKLLSSTATLRVEPKAWDGQTKDVGLYSSYQVGRMTFDKARPHPANLVESAAMATTPMPAPTYTPVLPQAVLDSQISEVQLEAVVYAGQAHAKMLPGYWTLTEDKQSFMLSKEDVDGAFQVRQGFFVADGTGVGKGTTASGIVADNFAQGRTKAVWLSRNASLIEDARRDLRSVGFEDTDIVSIDNYKFGTDIRLDKGILFMTYSTLRMAGRNGKKSRLQQVLDWLGEDFDGVIIMDEAHEMGNAAGGTGSRGVQKASQQGMIGLLMQYRLAQARIVYQSATGATEPKNLSYAPRMGLWGGPEAPFLDRSDFLSAASDGGIAFMEMTARELKAKGLYIARMLSFEGVEIDAIKHNLTISDIEIWDSWAQAFEIIHNNLNKALERTNIKDDGKTLSGQHLAAAKSAFASTSQRFFNALLTGLKAPSIIQDIRRSLDADMSAVVQIVSTNEATLERRLEAVSPSEWTDLNIDLTPKDIVTEYLQNSFPVQEMELYEDDSGEMRSRPLVDEDGVAVLSQEALALREETLIGLAMLPAVNGALDAIIHAFGTDMVAEVTGRSRRVVLKDGKKVLERRGAHASRSDTDDFNAGRKRILIFSNAGGTGRSYHADRRYENQQRRRHILVEAGFRADTAIQGIGRTHRSNQVQAPVFCPVTTDIHGEKRFLSTISRRLDSLGALTKGERRAASNGMFRAEDSLENQWANRAKTSLFYALYRGEVSCMSLDEFERKTGLTLTDGEGNVKESEDLPPMHTFLNRLLALRIADQNALFEEFDTRRQSILEKAAAAGQLDVGVEDLVADELDLINETTIRTDENGSETKLLEFKVRRQRELFSLDYIKDMIANDQYERFEFVLNGKSNSVGLAVKGIVTIDDEDRPIPAVRILRPNGRRSTMLVQDYEESNWTQIGRAQWDMLWEAEHAQLDPFETTPLWLVTGQLLPIWKHLSSTSPRVRRLKAPDGNQWLGRVLHEAEAIKLLQTLGIDAGNLLPKTASDVARLVMVERNTVVLASNLRLKASRVMDNWRLEIYGNQNEYRTLRAMGCFVEIINSTPRVFVSRDDDLLQSIIKHYPVVNVERPNH